MKLTPEQAEMLRRFPLGRRPNKVAIALELAGSTQADLCRALQLLQPYVSEVVRGRYRTIHLDKAQAIADCFGVAVEDLWPTKEAVAS